MAKRTSILAALIPVMFSAGSAIADLPVVVLRTTMGDIHIELDDVRAPITVANFLRYVDEGFYDGEDGLGATTFHRVIEDFVLQGGGHLPDMTEKATHEPIFNESHNGLSNRRGSIAMARTSEPHTATSQFYINHVDNLFLDPASEDSWGYAVFGRVVTGMDVVDAIAVVATQSVGGFQDVPIVPIIINDATPTVRYVDPNATGTLHNGQTWCNAYLHLQDALTEAAANPGIVTEIRVADGTYRPDRSTANPTGTGDRTATFQLVNGVTLAGGYAGCNDGGDERDISVYESILSGDLAGDDGPDFANNAENSYHVVTGSGTDDTAVLEGFTITAGNADGAPNDHDDGAGMYNDQGSPRLVDCVFLRNKCDNCGAGLYVGKDSSPEIVWCQFIENASDDCGGGMAIGQGNSSPRITNSTFRANVVRGGGGAIYVGTDNTPLIENCLFAANVVSENCCGHGGNGGGLLIRLGSDAMISGCTFYGNSAYTSSSGGGIYNEGNASVTNSIFWGNSDIGGMDESAQIHDEVGSVSVVNHSDIQGGWTGGGGNCNINADPLFIDADGDDNVPGTVDDNLRLSSGSPCIDQGNNGAVPVGIETDIDGGPRFCDDPDTADCANCPQATDCGTAPIVDMGAHEYCDCNGNDIDDAQDIEDCAGDLACDDCNGNGIPDGCDIADGPSTDVNGSGIPDECELPLLPPVLPADPVHAALKNRYLSIDPTTNGDTPVALEVKLTSMLRCSGDDRRACIVDDDCPNVCTGNPDLQCANDGMCGADGPCVPTSPCVEHGDVGTVTRWIDVPTVSVCTPLNDCHACSISGAKCNPEMILACNDGIDGECLPSMWFAHLAASPVYRVWTEEILHLKECEVVPVAEYEIRAVLGQDYSSEPLTTGTIIKPDKNYADCVGPVDPETQRFSPPDGFVNVVDVTAYLFGVSGNASAPHTTWIDLHGLQGGKICEPPDIGCIIPQQILNVSDLQTIKFGFQGKTYVQTPGQADPGDCP